jgi:CubicO group peptidase (beta-lactamase class C family)
MDMQSGVHYEYSEFVFRDGELLTDRLTSMTEDGVHYRTTGLLPRLPDDQFASQYDFFPTLSSAKRDHGSIFCYKCSDACVLAWACERVTNERFSDLISTHVWSKLGAEHDASIVCDSKGAPTANGGMSVTLRDLARWGQMHIQQGKYNGNEILPKLYLDDVLQNADPKKVTDESFGALTLPGFAYRSQYPVLVEHGAYNLGGAWGQTCFIHPESETVIVKFSTCSSMELYKSEILAFQQITRQLLERANSQLGSEETG